MSKSIKGNFVYNMIGTVSGFLFPMITFPYVSRVIMAEGIGQVQFYTSIINYIVLLTSLGIPLYATREIARVRDNAIELSRTTIEIISLNLILNLIGYVVLFIICFTFDEIIQNIPLFILLSSSIFLTTIGCPWFYSGIEDFKYVTIRGLIIKVICVCFLFIFVKDKDDLMYYATYTVLGTIGNYILNFIRLRKYIRLDGILLRDLNIWHHLKPAFAIFVFNLVTSIYVNLDKVMVGLLKDSESVGYYTSASMLSHILLTIITSLGVVMLPRLSNCIKNGNMDVFNRLARKSYNFIVTMSFPICGGLIILAPNLIRIFSGEGFLPAITTLQILSPIIVAIGISNLLGIQILYPLGKIKIVTLSTMIGAIVNCILNILLIPSMAQDGAAIATVCAELCVTLAQFALAKKFVTFKFIDKQFFYCFATTVIMMSICHFFIVFGGLSDIMNLIIVPIIGGLIYGTVMLILKNEIVIEGLYTITTKIKKYLGLVAKYN